MGVIVGASLVISMIAVVAGWMGSHDYLGFTVMSRAYILDKMKSFLVLTSFQIMGDDWWILASFEPYRHCMYLVSGIEHREIAATLLTCAAGWAFKPTGVVKQ
jgi:hypothetical protein